MLMRTHTCKPFSKIAVDTQQLHSKTVKTCAKLTDLEESFVQADTFYQVNSMHVWPPRVNVEVQC